MIQGQDYSDLKDVRPKSAGFEEKRVVRLGAIGSVPTVPSTSSFELLSDIVQGYGVNQRVDSKIVVTSIVVRVHLYNQSELLSSPQSRILGRVGLVADTMFRTGNVIPPFGTMLNESLVWYLDGGDWTHTCENIERSSERFVVLATEPWKLKPVVVPYQVTSEVQYPEVAVTSDAFSSLPRFENVTTAKIIDGVGGAQESIIGGSLYDTDSQSFVNVGAHYNLDVSQQQDSGGSTIYPLVNAANATGVNPFSVGIATQAEFIVGGVSPGPIGVTNALNLPGRIFNNPTASGYPRDILAQDRDRGLVTGGLTFPMYQTPQVRSLQSPFDASGLYTHSNFYCTGDAKFIDIEFDFPDGLPVTYNSQPEVYQAPDVGLYFAYTAVDGPFTTICAFQSVIYFYDGEAWAQGRPVGDDWAAEGFHSPPRVESSRRSFSAKKRRYTSDLSDRFNKI